MSSLDVSLSLPAEYPRKDALEEQVERLVIYAPRRTLFGRRIISAQRQQKLALVVLSASYKGRRCAISFSEHRQRHYFSNSKVEKGTLDLKRGMERHEALIKSKQQDIADRICETKKTFTERQEELNQAQKYLKSGYDKAVVAFRAGEKLDRLKITKNRKYQKVVKKSTVSGASAVEGAFWSNIGVKCRLMDLESEKLYLLRGEAVILEKAIETLEKGAHSDTQEIVRLRNDRAEILAQIQNQTKSIDEIERDLTIETLNTLTEEGSECAESIQKIIKDGLQVCVSVKSMVTGIGLVGSLLAFGVSLDTIISNGKSVEQMEANARALRSLLNDPVEKTSIATVLVNNMYMLKLDHLNRSIGILREEAKSAVATLVSSTLSAGKFSVALAALAASAVLAAPGLNITAITIAALTSVGLKGLKLFNAIKYDREGVKLDVQIAEESAKLVTSSGEFYSNAVEFDAIRAEIDLLMGLEADVKGAIREIRTCMANFRGDDEAEEFYESLEDELQNELLPISQKKLEYQMKYDLLQGELYKISMNLDLVTVYKRRLQEDRSMEAIAAEFSRTIKKRDIVGQYRLFKEVLSNQNARFEFLEFLSREDIPVSSEDLIFESVLTFIRNDKHMPRSLKNLSIY